MLSTRHFDPADLGDSGKRTIATVYTNPTRAWNERDIRQPKSNREKAKLKTLPVRMPSVNKMWLLETSTPRSFLGASSATYTGTTMKRILVEGERERE